MASNKVHAGERLTLTATTAHTAGDLVWCKGFFGVVQDDVVSGDKFTLILNGVWNLKRAPATSAIGAVLSAPATEQATGLPLGAASPTIGNAATAGWWSIGKVIATGTATTAKVQLFNPNPLNRS